MFVARESLVLLLYFVIAQHQQFRDEAESSQESLPAVQFPSNAVYGMLQHARNNHIYSNFYNLVVQMSPEEVELEIREARLKRSRL